MDPLSELALYHENLAWMLERVVDAARESGDRAATRPPVPEANSPVGIANHALGAALEHVLGWGLGQELDPESDAFADSTLDALVDRHLAVVSALDEAFATLAGVDMDSPVETPGRGAQPLRAVLQWAVLHASEHAGAAELTKDIVLGLPGATAAAPSGD